MRVAVTRRSTMWGLASLLWARPALARRERLIPPTIDAAVASMMRTGALPGLGVGYVRHGRIVSVQGYGFADVEARRPVTPDTAFHIASVSKVVTATALMQLWDRAAFALDDPIEPHLDFIVLNPKYNKPITFRHLLNHTSSISDKNYQGFGGIGDPRLSLRDFLSGYLSADGKWFTPGGSYFDVEPGVRYYYSNVGAALAGYLAERLAGRSLKEQSRDRIFEPLNMRPAAWTLADLGTSSRATPYDEVDGKLQPIAPIGYPDWPAGLLRASPRAMTLFMAAYANHGSFKGTRILSAKAVDAMFDFIQPPPFPGKTRDGQGLMWEKYITTGPLLIGKGGADQGAQSFVALNPTNRSAIVLLSNRRPTLDIGKAMLEIAKNALLE